MPRLRVDCFSISLDGYGAGPQQSFDNPLGVGGESLHDWFVVTRSFRQGGGQAGGETGVDDDFAARGAENLGAFIMGATRLGHRKAATGAMTHGKVGGVITRPITGRSSYSPTTHGHRHAQARLRAHRTCADGKGHPYCA